MQDTRQIEIEPACQTIVASVRTDPGCIRESNEDSGRHVINNDSAARRGRGTLTIVADGMGGHASGEIASQMAVDLISELYYASDRSTPGDALIEAVETANSRIFHQAATDERYFGMGTTVIALVLDGNIGFSAHVGDSRLYRFRRRHLELLTIDHSQVMEMVRHGIISMEEARDHDDKNVILRAVGTQADVEVEISDSFEVQTGDIFLLCSDGLNDMLDDAAIEEILGADTDIHSVTECLIAAAKENGGHDNITVGLIRIDPANAPEFGSNVRVTREVEALT